MSLFKKLMGEAHQRALWQIVGIYLAASWVVLQVVGQIADSLVLPEWVEPLSIILLLVGFPIVLATAFIQGGVGRKAAAPVPESTAADAGTPGGEPATATAAAARAPEAAVLPTSAGAHHRLFTWRNAIVGGGMAMLLLVVLSVGYLVTRTLGVGPAATLVAQGVLDERDRIVLAQFENRTDDPQLAEVVTEALRVDLAQSQTIRLADPAFVAGALRRMEQPADAPLTEELARELAQREGLKGVLSGDIGAAGDGFVLSAQLVVPETGEILTSQRESARESAAIIPAIDELSKKLRERIGEPLRSIAADQPLERVTTSDLEALRKYTQAIRANDIEGDWERGISLLEESVDRDSAFAMGWRKLGMELRNRDEQPARAREAFTRAFEHRDRLPERERYLAMAAYYDNVTGEQDKAILAYENMLEANPSDDWALNNLGVQYTDRREYARAEELYMRAIAADSDAVYPYTNAVNVQAAQGKYEEAEATLEALERHTPGTPGAAVRIANMAAARGDYEEARRLGEEFLETFRDSPIQVQGGLSFVSAVNETQGRLAEGERYRREQQRVNEQRGVPAEALDNALESVWTDLLVREDPTRALARVEAALAEYPMEQLDPLSRPYLDLAALHAFAGDVAGARNYLAAFETELDEEQRRPLENWYIGTRGTIAMAEGRYSDALEDFRRSEEGACNICPAAGYAALFDRAGEADSTIVYMERYVTEPWIFRIFWDNTTLGPSYERLGELYDEKGDLENAAKYYAMFVELWEEADEELQSRVRAAQARLEEIVRERG
jgi:tetratricopeptide (TPR) repeat protein